MYKPYPIYDMRQGKVTDRESWLLPKDAFRRLRNGHLRLGVLEKRGGYTEFGEIVHTSTTAGTDTNPGNEVMGIFNYYLGDVESLLAMDTERVNKYNTTTDAFVDLTKSSLRFKHASKQNWEPSVGDTVKGATSGATADVEAVVVDTGTFAGTNANGTIVFENTTVANGPFQDGEELQENGTAANKVGNAHGASSDNELTGDDSQFLWLENWDDIGYMTNSKDQIRKYNGANLTLFNIDLDVEGGPDNDVNTCLLIFIVQDRIVLFRPTERGVEHTQRARYGQVRSTTIFKDDDWVNAPTEDSIVAADKIGDDVYVWFERSIWKFAYTADPDQPFRWEQIISTEGCYATMSLLSFSDELMGVGPTRIIGFNRRQAYGLDDKIPDFMLEWNQSAIAYCYGLVLEEMSQAWISYTSTESELPDSALVLNYVDNCYSTYGLPIHVLGYSTLESDLILDEIDASVALDDLDYSFDDKELQAGYPTTLMGCRDGKVYQLNDGGSDDGAAIAFSAVTGDWNPHFEEGHKSRLGWVDFLVDRDELVSFAVDFYINSEAASYKTQTVECTETGTQRAKVWKRVFCGCEAEFHSIDINNDDTANAPRIHAIVPWFERGGPLF